MIALIIIIIIVSIIFIILFSVLLVKSLKNKSNKIKSIDRKTKKHDRDKYKSKGMELIFSNEMKDLDKVKEDFVFEEQPYGTNGTGDQNYAGDKLVKLTKNGLYLGVAPNKTLTKDTRNNDVDNKNPRGRTGKYKFNGNEWDSTKMTGRKKIRYKYGTIEFKVRCPKLTGCWPAGWLNFCTGLYGPDKNNHPRLISAQKDWPYPCGMFWPPEIDIMERWSPVLADDTVYKEFTKEYIDSLALGQSSMNESSVHSANQYAGIAMTTPLGPNKYPTPDPMPPSYPNYSTAQYKYSNTKWCPQGVCNSAPPKPGLPTPDNKCDPRYPGQNYSFGTSVFNRDSKNSSTNFIVYRCDWTPHKVSFYMDDVYYGEIDYRSLAFYRQGSVGPIKIPSVPMFPVFNISLLIGCDMTGNNNNLGTTSAYNFIDSGEQNGIADYKPDGMEIAWIRIYQDKNGSGLNPAITPEDEQQIFSSKSGVNLYSTVSNIGDTSKLSTQQEIDDYVGNLTDVGCKYLASKKDNFCLGVDAAMLTGNNGYLPNDYNQTLAQSVLAYTSDVHNVDCSSGTCKEIPYKVAPNWLIHSDEYRKYGWPKNNVSPKAPCMGVQTATGYTSISQYKCV